MNIENARCNGKDFKFIFGIKTLHVSDSSSAHQKEFFTVQTAMVYVVEVC